MKKATERSVDRAYSLVHPSMRKPMKRSVHQQALASSSSWWTAPGAYDEVSTLTDFLGWWPSIPENQIRASSSSADRANDSKLAADSMMTDTSTMMDDEAFCDLLDQQEFGGEIDDQASSSFLGQHLELGGETGSSFFDLEDCMFGFDATTDSTMTLTTIKDDEYFDLIDGVIKEQREMDKFVRIGGEVFSAAAILPGELAEDLEVSEWIEAEMDTPPAAVMTGEQSRAIADSFQHLGIR